MDGVASVFSVDAVGIIPNFLGFALLFWAFAKLSGISDVIINRAKAVLKELETDGKAANLSVQQPSSEPVSNANALEFLTRLQRMDANTITPIEALSVLAELIAQAKELDI